jgi:hypothetical protein
MRDEVDVDVDADADVVGGVVGGVVQLVGYVDEWGVWYDLGGNGGGGSVSGRVMEVEGIATMLWVFRSARDELGEGKRLGCIVLY